MWCGVGAQLPRVLLFPNRDRAEIIAPTDQFFKTDCFSKNRELVLFLTLVELDELRHINQCLLLVGHLPSDSHKPRLHADLHGVEVVHEADLQLHPLP